MDFIAMLLDMQRGECAAAVNTKLQELVQAVRDTAGKGTITVKVDIKPAKLGMGGSVLQVVCDMDCTIKKPELKTGDTTFFLTDDGALTSDNPAQAELFEERMEKRNG